MLNGDPDPYLFFELLHARRSEMVWWLSADLGLYEALSDGPTTLEDLSAQLGLQTRPMLMLLSANGCLGIVRRVGDDYSLQPTMRSFVLPHADSRFQSSLRAWGRNHLYDSWKQALIANAPLAGWQPPWVSDPDGKASPTVPSSQRDALRVEWGRRLAAVMDWSEYHVVADIGGATGGVLVGLTEQQPHLRGVVLDLPYCRQAAQEVIAYSGAAGRVAFRQVDMFVDALPNDADVFLMSHVLHDWDDSTCIGLLHRCHDALPPGAPLLAMEFLLDEDKMGPFLAALQWLWLVLGTSGDQRTGTENAALLAKAGFCDIQTLSVDEHQSVVIGWKR